MSVTASSRLVDLDKNCSPPPFKLARDGWSSSRPTPPPDRETLFVQADRHHQRGSNPKAPIRFQEHSTKTINFDFLYLKVLFLP